MKWLGINRGTWRSALNVLDILATENKLGSDIIIALEKLREILEDEYKN
jgi:hypothetical protein